MKKWFIWGVSLCLTMSLLSLSPKTDTSMDNNSSWKKVEQFEKKSLPKSALDVVDQIYQQAYKKNDIQQVIKALIYRSKLGREIDADKNIEIFSDLETLLVSVKSPVDKALLHSLLGELYLDYLNAHFEINQRTAVEGIPSADLNEWSRNNFEDKARAHFVASVSPVDDLLKTDTKSYSDLILQGEDSRKIYPTMYDFLMNRAIEFSSTIGQSQGDVSFLKSLAICGLQINDVAAPASNFIRLDFKGESELLSLEFYQEFLESLEKRGLKESLVFTEISRSRYLSGRSKDYNTNFAYKFLLGLEERNKAYDFDAEVIGELASYLRNAYAGNYTDIGTPDEDLKKQYEWLKLGIQRYPNYRRINVLKNALSILETPIASVEGIDIYHPDNKNKELTLNYRNLKSATVKLLDQSNKEVWSRHIVLAPRTTYSTEKIHFNVDFDQLGTYRLSVDFDKKPENESSNPSFVVSKLAYFVRASGPKRYEFYVVDRLSGMPLEDESIVLYLSENYSQSDAKRITSVKTDNRGFASLDLASFSDNKGSYFYRIEKENDKLLGNNSFPYYSGTKIKKDTTKETEVINIFTDRDIYRPGQTIFFKAVASSQTDGEKFKLLVGSTYKVRLLDANRQVVSEKELTTNDFGSVAGEFVLPQKGLAGQYYIEVGNASQYVRVEEYKRPTFQVELERPKGTYQFGDKITIKGNAEGFSGVKLQGTSVTYNVKRNSLLRWWHSPLAQETVASGTGMTADDGSFDIDFTIPAGDARRGWLGNSIYNFEVVAEVTDTNGETQSGTLNFPIGNVSMVLTTNLSEELNKDDSFILKIEAQNLNGEQVDASGTYAVWSLLPNDSVKAKVLSGNFSTSDAKALMQALKKLPSAKYKLSLMSKDDRGREVVADSYVTLYSVNDTVPPIETNEWLVAKETSFGQGKDAEIIFGVSAQKATILFDLVSGYDLLERQQFELSNGVKYFKIPYKSEYGDNITAVFTYVIGEKSYVKQVPLTKVKEDRNLDLKFEVFRDKLRPGQKEEWRISVKNSANRAVSAEILASMYDSSLDKLVSPKNWGLTYLSAEYLYPSLFQETTIPLLNVYYWFNGDHYPADDLHWDQFNWFGFQFYGRRHLLGGVFELQSIDAAAPISDAFNRVSAPLKQSKQKTENTSLPQKPNGEQAVRSNFAETAFFYPQLKTNSQGEAVISFTVPESNTTWKFRALAYDQSFNSGSLEALVVSRKELMVTPNLPRFMREGDKASISTKISNLSDKALKGKVRVEFFDPLTDQLKNIPVLGQVQEFSLVQDASASVSWSFNVPAGMDLIGCRIVAETASFSDGEQHVIPILPDRMLVTESMAMNLKGGSESKQFKFDKMLDNHSKTLSNYRLTFEYADNPTWYAVQALPVLANPTGNGNAISWFDQYYANILSASIVHQYPRVASMIRAWKEQGGTKESLVSGLQKNEELKAVLLEETPWVLDAKNETEQMNRLSLLFDLNNSTMQTSQAVDELGKLQRADGGWPWYQGMNSNRATTQYLMYGFAQLIRLNAVEYPEQVKLMQLKALKYMDKMLREDFESLKKTDKQWRKITAIGTDQLEYLATRANYRDIPIDKDTREAERFYTSVVENNWTKLNLYERSLLVVLLRQNGNSALADDIMKSLREHAVQNDEMGMFWANNRDRSFMGQSPIVVHTSLMEAFRQSKASDAEMNGLKQWLLKQKQVQAWESPYATANAIYALLSTGSDWLADSDSPKIEVGKEKLVLVGQEVGTGYVKRSWSNKDITPDMANVSIERSANAPAWGALYWQYYEDLDKISAPDKGLGLSVSKSLFVEKNADKGTTLVKTDSIHVGDRVVVRLTVRADRDMEFVSLKDMRASCFEPIDVLSGMRNQGMVSYYQSTKDASTNFFFDRLPKGTYVFEYSVYANRAGIYSNGITTLQSSYAPEFSSHTSGLTVTVE